MDLDTPGALAEVHRILAVDESRNVQIADDVSAAWCVGITVSPSPGVLSTSRPSPRCSQHSLPRRPDLLQRPTRPMRRGCDPRGTRQGRCRGPRLPRPGHPHPRRLTPTPHARIPRTRLHQGSHPRVRMSASHEPATTPQCTPQKAATAGRCVHREDTAVAQHRPKHAKRDLDGSCGCSNVARMPGHQMDDARDFSTLTRTRPGRYRRPSLADPFAPPGPAVTESLLSGRRACEVDCLARVYAWVSRCIHFGLRIRRLGVRVPSGAQKIKAVTSRNAGSRP